MQFILKMILGIMVLMEGIAMAQPEQDLVVIANRLRTEFAEQAPDGDRILSYLNDQQADGHWPDVDYDDVAPTHWSPQKHSGRLAHMACAYGAVGHTWFANAQLREGILNGLAFWANQDPKSNNWWFNSISTPRDLGPVLLMMKDEVSGEVRDKIATIIRRSGFTRTGSNLTWEANNLMVLACAVGDVALLKESIGYLTKEIQITTEEGIQCDYSFHQHGPQLYMSNYGSAFSRNNSRYCVLFFGTSFALGEEKVAAISKLIREGQQWFLWGRQFDYHALGRQLDTPNAKWRGDGFVAITTRMAKADPEHAEEYRQFARRLKGDVPPGQTGPKGNRHYWRSDIMVHRPGDFYVSVRMHSTRTYATEVRVNRENLKGYHLSDGAYFLMQRGDEFHDIQPTWNWRKLPGVTYRNTDEPFPYGRSVQQAGNTDFVGGVSDGQMGMAAMDYAKDDVLAHKAWFFFDRGFVCLGAGITAQKDASVTTSLNQTLLQGEVVVLQDEAHQMAQGERVGNDLRAVYHDGVGYYLVENQKAVVRAHAQTGTWTSIEERSSRKDSVTKDVFDLWVDHGTRPMGATYAYAVMPGVDHDSFMSLAEVRPFRVLANQAHIQAVAFPDLGVIQAAFYEAGEVQTFDKVNVVVDAPCLVMLRQKGDQWALSVSDPTQKLDQLQIKLNGAFHGEGAVGGVGSMVVTVDLPQNEWAGQSVTVLLSKK